MKKEILLQVDVTEYHDENQRKVMEQIVKDGVCPFCTPHLAKYHHEPTLWENQDWLVTRNDYPYEGTRLHLLIICKHHLERVRDIDINAWMSFGEAVRWANKYGKIKGGALVMRFGDGAYNGSSVRHLHAHIIVGAKKGKNTGSMKIKVGYHQNKRG